jgi:hypothetical protein
MQAAHRFVHLVAVHNEREVDAGGAERDHMQSQFTEGGEGLGPLCCDFSGSLMCFEYLVRPALVRTAKASIGTPSASASL